MSRESPDAVNSSSTKCKSSPHPPPSPSFDYIRGEAKKENVKTFKKNKQTKKQKLSSEGL